MNKIKLCQAVIILMLFDTVFARVSTAENQVAIIPQPNKIIFQKGEFILYPDTIIQAGKPEKSTAQMLVSMLGPTMGYRLAVRNPHKGIHNNNSNSNCIILKLTSEQNKLGSEGYYLKVEPEIITITACNSAGLFYGCVTLRQLLPADIYSPHKVKKTKWFVPCLEITDKPRFVWRGLMIDCSRTFWRKEYIKRYLNLLADCKMNVLHLHLTDDQGWRVEIKHYPELTNVCSYFAEKYHEPPERQGFYTQQDIREIVKYAHQRHITVVPEIEMPGHCSEVFAAYPELSCRMKKIEIYPFFKGPTVTHDVYCAGNEQVFVFLQNVLTEIMDMFDSKYIHIGGDECPKDRWKNCPKCQNRIKQQGLVNEQQLQNYFIKRIEKFLRSKHHNLIGWDEILQGGLAPEATVMSWRGTNGGIKAAQHGHEVVMSPRSYCYFDYSYKQTPLEKVYSFEPIPAALTSQQHHFILGAQANMWTHIARTETQVDKQIFPRLLALAEVVWSDKTQKNWNDFQKRMVEQYKRLDYMQVHWYGKQNEQ